MRVGKVVKIRGYVHVLVEGKIFWNYWTWFEKNCSFLNNLPRQTWRRRKNSEKPATGRTQFYCSHSSVPGHIFQNCYVRVLVFTPRTRFSNTRLTLLILGLREYYCRGSLNIIGTVAKLHVKTSCFGYDFR